MANIFNNLNIKRFSYSAVKRKRTIAIVALVAFVFVLSVCMISNRRTDVGDYSPVSVNFDDYELAATGDDVEIIYNEAVPNKAQAQSRTTISVEDVGRSDPFLPDGEIVIGKQANINRPKPSFDLLPPPETITSDKTATEIMTTKVSGLMYDKKSPSAIININNNDYLVRKGDVVNDYKVLDINSNSVTVQYGANVYKAGVGELFTGSGVNYNAISNLESKFGGAGNSVNKK